MSTFHSGSTNHDDPVRSIWLDDPRLLAIELMVLPDAAVSLAVRSA
jgi:hypothetical protein